MAGKHVKKIGAVLAALIGCGFFAVYALDYFARNQVSEGVLIRRHLPEMGAQAPLVLLLGGSEGGFWDATPREVQDLQDRGAVVVELAYFGMPGIARNLSSISLDQFGAVFDDLLQQGNIAPECFVVIGVSKGAELALNLGARFPEIRAVVAVTPAHVSFQGSSLTFLHHSSWRYQNRDVPFVRYPVFSMATLKGVIDGEDYVEMHKLALARNPERVKAAEIAVENINGPVFLLSGERDQMWPSPEMARAVETRLVNAGFPFPVQRIDYPIDHYIFDHPHAWPDILHFLDASLFAPNKCGFSRP